jgi:hypothetical protein
MDLIRNARFPVSVTTFPNLQNHGRDDDGLAECDVAWRLAARVSGSLRPFHLKANVLEFRSNERTASLRYSSILPDHRVLSMDLATNAIAYRGSPALVRAFRKIVT